MTIFTWCYVRLLRRAPAAFRERFGAEMVALAEARLRDEGRLGRVSRAARELVDLMRAIRRERSADPGQGRAGAGATIGGWMADAVAALRVLIRRPAGSLGLMLILALGLGAATLGFALVSTVVLRPLPYGDPDALALLWCYVPQIQFGFPDEPVHGRRIAELRQTLTSAASIEGFKADVFNLEADGAEAQRIDGLLTTASLFETMRVRPAAGRFFVPGEDVAGAPCAAVAGYGLWQRVFGGRSPIVGLPVRLNGRACTIVGVAPRGFDFPRGGEMPAAFQYPSRTELWVAAPPPQDGPSDLTVLARLRDGVSVAAAQAEAEALATARDLKLPSSKGWNRLRVVPLRQQVVPASTSLTVLVLFAALAALLVVAVGNAAQLAMVHGLGRRMDLSVRAALGAHAARVVRLVGLEVALATLVAAGGGLSLAAVGVRLVRALGPARFPRLAEASLDAHALWFLLAAAAIAGAVTASGPAWLARRACRDGVLHSRARGMSDSLRPLRSGLIAVQVSLAVLLIALSALLVRSFIARLHTPLGFRPAGVTAFEITLPPARFPETLRGPLPAVRPTIIAAVDRVLAKLRAVPGVTAAALGKPLPMSGAQEASVFAVDGAAAPRSFADIPIAEYIVVSDDLFRALGTPVVAGREFTSADRETSQPAVVVNDTMANRLWPGQRALGRRIKLGSPASPAPWMTVVGVVPDMKRYGLDDEPGPAMYVPYTQGPYPSLATLPFAVRSTRAPADLLPEIRAAVRDSGLQVPVAAVQSAEAMVARTSADAEFATRLILAVAIAALALTVAGLYGSVALAVSRRRRELGIRLALGAEPRALVRLVVAEGVRPALLGLLVGLPAAVAAAMLMRRLLFGVAPSDPWTYVIAAALLAGVVGLACFVPARRAAVVDPRETLQGE